MFTLGLEYLLNNARVIESAELSYEQLYNSYIDNNRQLLVTQLNLELDDVYKTLITYSNFVELQQYVQKHGIDNCVRELISNESILTNIHGFVIKIAQTISKKIVVIIGLIKSLFKTRQEKAGNNRNKAYALLEQNADALEIIRTLKLSPVNQIRLHSRLDIVADGFEIIAEKLHYCAVTKSALSTSKVYFQHDIPQCINSIINAIDTEIEYIYSKDIAIEYAKITGDAVDDLHTFLSDFEERLLKLPKLSNNPTEEEAKNYIKQCINVFIKDVDFKALITGKAINEFRKSLTDSIKLIQSIVDFTKKLENIAIGILTKIISKLAAGHTSSRDVMMGRASGGIHVEVPMPASIMTKLQKAWKTKFIVKRFIVTNVRGSFIHNANTSGVAFTPIDPNMFVTDVLINWNVYRSRLFYKWFASVVNQDELTQSLQHMKMDPDRINAFFITLAHECRHIWQYDTKGPRDASKDPKPKSDSETDQFIAYANAPHEVDARTASNEFVKSITDADRKWAEDLFKRCMTEELKNMIKYNN